MPLVDNQYENPFPSKMGQELSADGMQQGEEGKAAFASGYMPVYERELA